MLNTKKDNKTVGEKNQMNIILTKMIITECLEEEEDIVIKKMKM